MRIAANPFDQIISRPLGLTLGLIKLSARTWLLLGLSMSLLFSAFALIYVKDTNRRIVNDIQLVTQEYYILQAEHGRFMLEQSTWSSQARVQTLASEVLDLRLPEANEVAIKKVLPNQWGGELWLAGQF